MIIACTRVVSRDGHMALWNHVRKRQPDGPPRLIQGTENDLKLMVKLARAKGAKYAIRHYHLNPAEAVSEDRMREAVTALGREFSFDPDTAVIVAHDKPRTGSTDESEHWHVLASEVNAITGKTLDAHHYKRRHEKISRTLEAQWGHQIVKGRHNLAVVSALVKDGKEDVAKELVQAGITEGDPALSAYTSDQRRTLERKHPKLAMPALALAVQDGWRRADNMRAFQSALSEHGMRARIGDRKAEWIIEVHDADNNGWALVGGLKRLVQEKKDATDTRIKNWEKADAKKANNTRANKKADMANRGREQILTGGNPSCGAVRLRQDGPQLGVMVSPDIGHKHGDDSQQVGRPDAKARRGRRPAGGYQKPPGGHRDGSGTVGAETGPTDRLSERRRFLNRMTEQRLRNSRMIADGRLQNLGQALREGPPEPARLKAIARVPAGDRASFKAVLLRRAYGTGWLPSSVAQNIKHVNVDRNADAVRITLTTGTRIFDFGNRIILQGKTDDVGVEELVACIQRRGWTAVELTGDAEFQAEVARRLMRVQPPIEVVNNPLDPAERSAIRIEMAEQRLGERPRGVDWDDFAVPAYRPPASFTSPS